jgi:hypothetical protein
MSPARRDALFWEGGYPTARLPKKSASVSVAGAE